MQSWDGDYGEGKTRAQDAKDGAGAMAFAIAYAAVVIVIAVTLVWLFA